jgi:hypothetical protein
MTPCCTKRVPLWLLTHELESKLFVGRFACTLEPCNVSRNQLCVCNWLFRAFLVVVQFFQKQKCVLDALFFGSTEGQSLQNGHNVKEHARAGG